MMDILTDKQLDYKIMKLAGSDNVWFTFRSWDDLMPLVIDYLPMLGVGRKEFIDLLQSENPQRGLAECLLNVLQEKHGDD